MVPRYIHIQTALSDLITVMPISLSIFFASPEENACNLNMPCKSLIQGALYISYRLTLQAHSMEVSGITIGENMIQCINSNSPVKLTLRSVK